MRAIVVGAGLAGLSAADELRRSGCEVLVLEARDRVGGRVWSRRLANGAVVELGAEFILPGHSLVRELAGRFGLGLWDKGMRYGRREPRGAAVDPDALARAVDAIGAHLRDDPASAELPARTLIEQLGLGEGEREYVLARVEVSAANTADVVPARALKGLAHIDDEPSPSIAGGNQRLAVELARPLGDAVVLRSPVTAVRTDASGVTVTAPGAEVRGAACVVAVPATTIGEIDFEPPLPDAVRAALAGIRYGEAAKLFAPLLAPATPSAVMSVPERYWTWTATGADERRAQPVVSAFAGSPPALHRLATAAGPARWLASLQALRPDLALDPAAAVLSTWSDDPWVRAAYSTAPGEDSAEVLSQPVGPLALAGEHTAGEYAALMEGALRSGRRAARSLATRLLA